MRDKAVGHAMSDRITEKLVSRSLFRAVSAAKRPGEGLIHHSDQGSQYCAHDYKKQLKQFGMKSSMSRKGNCYDNVSWESFWGMLKNELVYHNRYKTRQEAMESITDLSACLSACEHAQAAPCMRCSAAGRVYRGLL